MGFWQYFWNILILAFSTPWQFSANIAGVLAIIFGIIVWRHPKLENTVKLLLWMIPLALFIVLTPIALLVGSYGLYEDKHQEVVGLQNTLNQEREQHRPILVQEVNTWLGSIDEQQQMISIAIDFNTKNIGGKPAYQTRIRQCDADLKNPQDIYAPPDEYETNPIFTDVTDKHLHVYYSVGYNNSESKVILIYVNFKYSDSPNGGNWYEQSYWWACLPNLKPQGVLQSARPEWISLFEPFVKQLYSGNP
jgi:hypothetical protein